MFTNLDLIIQFSGIQKNCIQVVNSSAMILVVKCSLQNYSLIQFQ